jgi:hypothetical protein
MATFRPHRSAEYVSVIRGLAATLGRWSARQFMTDTVEKGKNEPIKIFACARVETGFS